MKRREFIALLDGAAQESRILQPVSPILVAFSTILLTSVVLLAVDSFLDAEALAFIYLLPTVVMAMHYGSTVGVLTSFASALAAAYFCFPPKFSFYISDPLRDFSLILFFFFSFCFLSLGPVHTPPPPAGRGGGWRQSRLPSL